MNNAIAVQGVTKTYGTQKAVDNLSFEVQVGEIFAFLGPNGSGKTTTMRMILDILKPDSGRVEVLGGPLNEETKNRIGYMPEERGLYRNVPVQDLLVYLAALKGVSSAEAKRRSADLIERVALGEHLKSKVSELSKGMQQKVQFVATVLHRPELLIVDEPFSGLDPVNSQLLKDIVRELNRDGATVLMSTHMMQQVEEMGDRLLMINYGRRVLYGAVDEVRKRYADNAVEVVGQGDWEALPGVREVQHHDNGRAVRLCLAEGVTPDDIMQALAVSSVHHITSFALAVPSLEEIFIQVAGEMNGNA